MDGLERIYYNSNLSRLLRLLYATVPSSKTIIYPLMVLLVMQIALVIAHHLELISVLMATHKDPINSHSRDHNICKQSPSYRIFQDMTLVHKSLLN